MSDLFIPKKIKVGFQKREGTYTGQLAYVVYIDNKGKLRKEKSWEAWRDKTIDAQEYDNKPQDGFCLNKDVKRFNWSHFGSNRSYIRIYDSRGIEFEITPENLIGILTETDCLKRGLDGKFVYAWKGTELVVLPCGSEEYKKAVENTERQDKKVSTKELKPGCSYMTKKGEEVIYIGKSTWVDWNVYGYREDSGKGFTAKKCHIFAYPEKPTYGCRFFNKGDLKFLASQNTTESVLNYAELLGEWNGNIHSSEIKDWKFSPETDSEYDIFGDEIVPKGQFNVKLNKSEFVEKVGDVLRFWTIRSSVERYDTKTPRYEIIDDYTFNTKTMMVGHSSCHDPWRNNYVSKETIMNKVKNSVKVKAILSSGKKIEINSINDFNRN